MDAKASVHHQHDIPSRHAMVYVLTMSWSLAHTSLAVTPEQLATSGENSCLRPARAGRSMSLYLSSKKAPAGQSLNTRMWQGSRRSRGSHLHSAQSAADETTCGISKILCNFTVLMGIANWTGLILEDEKTTGDTCTASPRSAPGTQRWHIHSGASMLMWCSVQPLTLYPWTLGVALVRR